MSWRAFKFYLAHPIIFFRRLGYFFYEIRHPDEPWIAQKAVQFLDQNLKSDMVLFEWGSGRSTRWFAKRVQKVISIEYNSEWSQRVQKQLVEEGVENVSLKYIPLEHPLKAPTPKRYPKVPQYVAAIFQHEPESLDVIVVDGHYRLTCVDQGLGYLKKGGYLVIDNSNRSSKEEWGVPPEWPIVHESENVMTQTTIWKKTTNGVTP